LETDIPWRKADEFMSFWRRKNADSELKSEDFNYLASEQSNQADEEDFQSEDSDDAQLTGRYAQNDQIDDSEAEHQLDEDSISTDQIDSESGDIEVVDEIIDETITDLTNIVAESLPPELSDEERAALEELKRIREAEEAEEKLRHELELAEASALAAQLEIEQQEYLEDLSVLDGRVLPQLKVPDWREELEFVKESYEPCDLSDHIVKVSKRRLTARQIDHELAQSRSIAYERYLERASRRFKDKIDEDALLRAALLDLTQWRTEQGKSVAWQLVDRVNDEVLKAKKAQEDAVSFVENNMTFTNPLAIEGYRHFSRRIFIIPITTLYIMSVVALTYSRFEWIMKFLPPFNLGLSKTLFMIGGVASYFMLGNFWRYSKNVAKVQRQLVVFNQKYQEQEKRIRHAVIEHTRLSQQQPLVEPILQVLSKGYRVQLQSDVMSKVNATTEFDPASLPACVTLARALVTEEEKITRLKRRALNVLMTTGWRTNGLNDIARIHADSRMLDAHSLSLSSLDTDSMVSAASAQRILLEAFSNTSIHNRVSKERLIRAVKEIHREVLANWSSDDRPNVESLRKDGFDKISFRTSWLADEDGSEPWIPFLMEVLSEETAPFGQFNILDKRSELNYADRISSVAVVPHYFKFKESKIRIEQSQSTEVLPIDVVVRVDVSPWAEPNAFAVFADDLNKSPDSVVESHESNPLISGGLTGA